MDFGAHKMQTDDMDIKHNRIKKAHLKIDWDYALFDDLAHAASRREECVFREH